MQASFLYNPDSLNSSCHCATLTQVRNGDLFATWYAYPNEEYQDAVIVINRKPKSQANWQRSQVVLERKPYSLGNPVVYEDPDGSLHLMFVVLKGSYWDSAELQNIISTDGGITWSEGVVIWPKRGMMARHPPAVLGDQSLLLPAYDEADKQSVLLRSRAPYDSWEEAHRFDAGSQLIQPTLMRETGHRLTMLFRPTSDPKVIWRSHSSNDGISWSSVIQTTLPVSQSGIDGFYVDGQLAAVYNHTRQHQRFPLSISLSSDRGVSWSGPWHFDRAEFELSYPSFIVDSDNVIHGVYTYNRRMIKYVSFSVDELRENVAKGVE